MIRGRTCQASRNTMYLGETRAAYAVILRQFIEWTTSRKGFPARFAVYTGRSIVHGLNPRRTMSLLVTHAPYANYRRINIASTTYRKATHVPDAAFLALYTGPVKGYDSKIEVLPISALTAKVRAGETIDTSCLLLLTNTPKMNGFLKGTGLLQSNVSISF